MHKRKTFLELLNLVAHHPNPVTRAVYREILGKRLDELESRHAKEG